GLYEKLIIGCHDTSWHELEAQLHPYVKKVLLGHFSADLNRITNDQIREEATCILRECPVCGQATREIEDVSEAIIPAAIQRDIELLYVKDDEEFDRAGNIAALLRFRADQSKGREIQAA